MGERLTDDEVCDAANALINWFRSQEINAKDSGVVIALLAGTLIGNRASDEASLQYGVGIFHTLVRDAAKKTFELKQKRK